MRREAAILILLTTVTGCRPQASRTPARDAETPNGANGIQYHGGRVLSSPHGPNLYYIWYGDWSGDTGPTILTDLARHLGGSPYFNIVTTYHDAAFHRVRNVVNFRGATTDHYSQGVAPDNAKLRLIVSRAITGGLPFDTNGVYVILASRDVVPSSFCDRLCGNTGHFAMPGGDIQYAWVGNPARCATRCAPAQPTTGPNGNAGVDAMAATLVHEYINALMNSAGTGWSDSLGRGPASMCGTPELAFPHPYVAANGALATVRIGSRDYFLTANWVNADGGYCALRYPSVPSPASRR